MFCKNCGKEFKENSKYCSNCGASISQNYDNKNNNSLKKIIILLLLFIIIILLTITAVIVSKNKPGESKTVSRTIMIYMVGSNLEYQAGIATSDIKSIVPSEVDLKNVNVYLYTGGTKKWFNFVSSDENAIYKLTDNGFKKEKTYSKKNMGDPNTLNDLLTYGYKNSKTDKYDLVIYDHGGATDGAVYDDFTNDNLTLSDFKKALDYSPFNKNNKIETILFRTCLNGTIEVANIFKDYADYMIASEEITNGGSNASVLNYINDIKTTDSAIDYGKKYINAYDKQMQILDPLEFSSDPMYSIWDLSKLENLNNELDKFIGGINLKDNYADIVKVRSSLFQFAKDYHNINDYDTVDLYTLVDKLSPYSSVKPDKLKKAFNDVIIYNWSSIDEANGISIYFPYGADKKIQDMLTKVYDDLEFSKNYKKFIYNFKDAYNSKKITSFSNKLVENKSTVSKGKEFTLELTKEQARDYAESKYIIFKKEKDGKYTLVYSSNNTTLGNTKLKTNISNNLIKVKLDEDEKEDYFYIPLVERIHNNKRVISFGAVLENFDKEYKIDSARLYIDYDKKGKPYIVNAILEDSKESGASGTIAKLDNYTTYAVISSHYNILDENGNYTPNWNNEGIVQGYEIKKKEFKMKRVSLDDGDYYCVFNIVDIYGNSYYSKLVNLK